MMIMIMIRTIFFYVSGEEIIWMEKFNDSGIIIMEYVFNYFHYSIVYIIDIFHSG